MGNVGWRGKKMNKDNDMLYLCGALMFLGMLVACVYLSLNNHPYLAAALVVGMFSLRITGDDKKKEEDE